jgi:hypothetical protein
VRSATRPGNFLSDSCLVGSLVGSPVSPGCSASPTLPDHSTNGMVGSPPHRFARQAGWSVAPSWRVTRRAGYSAAFERLYRLSLEIRFPTNTFSTLFTLNLSHTFICLYYSIRT